MAESDSRRDIGELLIDDDFDFDVEIEVADEDRSRPISKGEVVFSRRFPSAGATGNVRAGRL